MVLVDVALLPQYASMNVLRRSWDPKGLARQGF